MGCHVYNSKLRYVFLEACVVSHFVQVNSFLALSGLRQPEANATVGKHVGLLVAPVKSKDRAQAKVMTDYKEDQSAGNWAKFQSLEVFGLYHVMAYLFRGKIAI